MNGPRVMALIGDENGCTLWRVYQPYTELQRRGYGAWFRHKDDPQSYTPDFPYLAATRLDAIVIPRLSWSDHGVSHRWIRSLHNVGLKVIYEVDDDVFTPQIAGRQQATTESDKTLEQLEQERIDRHVAIRMCDGVTVSNDALARVVRQHVEADTPVVVVPNAIDTRWWRRVLHGVKRVVPPLTIGWAGGARYQEDLAPLAEAWHNIARRYQHVRFVVQGFMADVLIDAVPKDRVSKGQWLPLERYPEALRSIDIGCASVTDIQFNRCKTPIKLWEYCLAGAVAVVSPALYGPVARDGQDCLIAETAAEWEAALSRLVEDAELRRRLWRAQRTRIAQEFSLEKNVLKWPEAWSAIIAEAKRPRLALAS